MASYKFTLSTGYAGMSQGRGMDVARYPLGVFDDPFEHTETGVSKSVMPQFCG